MLATEQGLRERKKRRTRRALIQAAVTLFTDQGYDETTVAEIAAAADVSTRTFFSYFPTKEEVLFADTSDRVAAAVEKIRGRQPTDRPIDVLYRVMDVDLGPDDEGPGELFGRLAPIRGRLLLTSPAVQGFALRRLLAVQQELARELHAAFPDELDPVQAAALIGAVSGALINTLWTILNDPARAERLLSAEATGSLRDELDRAMATVVAALAGLSPTGHQNGPAHPHTSRDS